MANTYGFPAGKVDSGKVVAGGVNGDWNGSMQRALEVASIVRSCSGKSNVISSQKRSRVKTASGGVSDHWEGNLSAYAVDLPTRGKTGDRLLACLMSKFNNGSHADYKGGKWLNITIDGYRYQFGWRVKNHYDHIHVGVKKTGQSSGKMPETQKQDKESELTSGLLKAIEDVVGKSDLLKMFSNVLYQVTEDEVPQEKDQIQESKQKDKINKIIKRIL